MLVVPQKTHSVAVMEVVKIIKITVNYLKDVGILRNHTYVQLEFVL